MIHHMSFGVSEPKRVADVLVELTGKTAMRAPSPPFPSGTWFVIAGDDKGTLPETVRAMAVLDPRFATLDGKLRDLERRLPGALAPRSNVADASRNIGQSC
jgi:hypothetical protein